MSMSSYVYRLTNKINGKMYIGKADDPFERLIRHFSVAKTGYNKNRQYQYIHKAIAKYGKSNFIFDIIEECNTSELALEREIYWIDKLETCNKNIGYNLTLGGEGGCTPETARKISKTLQGRINTLNGLFRRLYKLFCLLPNYKTDIYKSKNEIIRMEEAQSIINKYFNNRKISYDIQDANKKLCNELKQDVINLYGSGDILVAEIANYLHLTEGQIKYILSKYGNGIPTEEQKYINRSVAHKGKFLSEEHKKSISQSNMGKIVSLEVRKKISQANSGKNNGMFGKTISNETRIKLSEFQSSRARRPLTEKEKLHLSNNLKGKPRSPRIPIEIKNEVIQLYASGNYTKKQLADKFGLKYNSIIKIIKVDKKNKREADKTNKIT